MKASGKLILNFAKAIFCPIHGTNLKPQRESKVMTICANIDLYNRCQQFGGNYENTL